MNKIDFFLYFYLVNFGFFAYLVGNCIRAHKTTLRI